MFKKMLALVLAFMMAFTIIAPSAYAEGGEDMDWAAVLHALRSNPETAPILAEIPEDELESLFSASGMSDPSIPVSENEYTYEMKPGQSFWVAHTDLADRHNRYDARRFLYEAQPVSDHPSVATAVMEVTKEGFSDHLKLTFTAHAPGTATITAASYTEQSHSAAFNGNTIIRQDPYEVTEIQNWTIHVKVTEPELLPPKVELRITPEPYTKLVTGKPKLVEGLDITTRIVETVFDQAPELVRRFGLTIGEQQIVKGSKNRFNSRMWVYLTRDIVTIPNSIRSKFPYLKLPASIKLPASSVKTFVEKSSKWVAATAAAGKLTAQTLFKITPLGIAQTIVQAALDQVKAPRVEPEVTLEVVVTNPNSVPIYLDLWLSTPRVTHEGEKPADAAGILENLGSTIPDGVLSPPTEDPVKARDLFILYPEGDPNGDSSQTFKFKLDPEIVYNETLVDKMMSTHKRYVSDITVSGTWWEDAYCETPANEYEESIQLEVESFLLPKSEYQQLEHLFSGLTTAVTEVFQSLTAAPGLPDSEFVDLLDALPEGAPLMSPIGPPAPYDADPIDIDIPLQSSDNLFEDLDHPFSNLANPDIELEIPSADNLFENLEQSIPDMPSAEPSSPIQPSENLFDSLDEPVANPSSPAQPSGDLFDSLDQSFSNLANPDAGGSNPSAEARFDDLEDSFSNLVNP